MSTEAATPAACKTDRSADAEYEDAMKKALMLSLEDVTSSL
jgi:hypothetical protein